MNERQHKCAKLKRHSVAKVCIGVSRRLEVHLYGLCCVLLMHLIRRLSSQEQFLKLTDIEVASLDLVDFANYVPKDLNLLFLCPYLLTQVFDHRLILATKVTQTHLANVDRGGRLARVQSRKGCAANINCVPQQDFLLELTDFV